MLSTAIIVPCYNEEKRIKAPEFISFAQQQPDIKFYFVNDGSTDDTQKVLLQIKEASPSEIIALEKIVVRQKPSA
jgi:glycosyltransferase involved in cell wall biosynthesis